MATPDRTRRSLPPFWVEKVYPEDRPTFDEAFELMVDLYREGGYAPLSLRKARETFYGVMTEGMTFLARIEAEHGDDPPGMPVGVLAMTEMPFWYADDEHTHLLDIGFYVKPAYRFGRVGVELLKAAREEAQVRDKIALITVTSPDRRPKKTRATLDSQLAGFVPLGYTLRLT